MKKRDMLDSNQIKQRYLAFLMKIRDNKYVLLNISGTIESIFIKDIPNPIIR